MENKFWTRQELVELCIAIESVCPRHGCHVAMTGGCLYKVGYRKDADVLFYRIRQAEVIDVDGLFADLEKLGLVRVGGFSWCWKFTYNGRGVDILFPEENRLKVTLEPVNVAGCSFAVR